ncbi:MAG: tyrosine-type recombinase/integrase [Nitrososphaera sp.]
MVVRAFGQQVQVKIYGKDAVERFNRSKYVQKYVARKAVTNENSATTYRSYLMNFASFAFTKYSVSDLDAFIDEIKQAKHNPYDVLADLAAYLKNERGDQVSGNTIRLITVVTRKFMRFCGIAIDLEDFKEFVALPRKEMPDLDAIDKHDVIEILNSCKDARLKTFLMFLAATGARAYEASSIRIQDLRLDEKDPVVIFRSESTKTKVKRTCYLTSELATQLRLWLKIKYKAHRSTLTDSDGNESQHFVTPRANPEDVVFGMWHADGTNPEPKHIYDKMRENFAWMLEDIGKVKQLGDSKRRAITLHSFRRFVKTTISNLGYQDFGEYFIGHASSTYWRTSEKEKLVIFRKIEPFLTYLDVSSLEARGADIQSQVEQERERNIELQHQLGTLLEILATPNEVERQRKLTEAARDWIQKGVYKPKSERI